MIVLTHRSFDKKYVKLPKKLRENARERIELFSANPLDALLNNHALVGKWLGYRSINVTGDHRAIFKQEKGVATFVDIDTHHNLYGT